MQPEGPTSAPSVIPSLRLIRRRDGEQRATFFELYFDLVYVFAVTQLSHHLLQNLGWAGAAETAFMLVAVYWVWNYTTWMANWFDPETVPVRLILVYVMLASLLMAVAVPGAFAERGLLFAASYAALQIGRNTFVVAVTPPGPFNRNFRQILVWSVASAPLWVAGGLVTGGPRWLLWLAALGMDLAAPLVRYWLPGIGPTPMSQWQVDSRHFAERFQLFVIIALGENVVLAGVTASDTGLGEAVLAALGVALVASTALWWVYFSQFAGTVARLINRSSTEEVGQLGRDVYTYLHLPIVAGIVLTAVGVEIVIAHPGDPLHATGAAVMLGGPALYLLGIMASTVRIRRRPSWLQALTVAILLATIYPAAHARGLLVLSFVAVVLVALAAADQIQARSTEPASST
jgi:low temperature requirement protein LtrA